MMDGRSLGQPSSKYGGYETLLWGSGIFGFLDDGFVWHSKSFGHIFFASFFNQATSEYIWDIMELPCWKGQMTKVLEYGAEDLAYTPFYLFFFSIYY